MKSTNNTVGLILGKFAPLHHGHQLVIETALREMERVIVLIYDSPHVTSIPLSVRAGWIRRLYPEVEVMEGWSGPPDTGDTPEMQAIQETYILGILRGITITHFYSSEFYGVHMSLALGAVNRVVDEARSLIPVSATQIRNDPYAFRTFLSPVVYRDIVVNVVFVGAPSTGKSTIAKHLASTYNTVWMREYGREYWEKHQIERRLTLEQLAEIAEGHLKREDGLLLTANRLIFTDTNAITTYIFSLDYHGRAHERLCRLADLAEKRYDIVFLCDIDIPFDDTWDRSGEVQRYSFQKRIIADLQTRRIPYIMLSGSLEDRCERVKRIIDRYRKFSNIVDSL